MEPQAIGAGGPVVIAGLKPCSEMKNSPSLSKQAAIFRFLNKTATKIDESSAQAKRKIDLLRKYRSSMIADVVTGKLGVRQAAARSPELIPPLLEKP